MFKGILPPHLHHKIESISWLYQTLLEVAFPTSNLWTRILKSTRFQPLPGPMCFRGVWPQIQVPDPDRWLPTSILFTSDHFRHETQFCKIISEWTVSLTLRRDANLRWPPFGLSTCCAWKSCMKLLLPSRGSGRHRDWQRQRRREDHREVKPDPDDPCQELSCLWNSFYVSLLFKVLSFACFVPCNQRHPNWLRGERNREDRRDSSSAWMRELASRDPQD